MPRSPFEIAFDHLAECPNCCLVTRKMCLDGRLLFEAAHRAAVMLAGMDTKEPLAKA